MLEPALEQVLLDELKDRYVDVDVDPEYLRLYPGGQALHRMCTSFHQRLNELFKFMNYKAGGNRHFNAAESRELLSLIEEIDDAQQVLERAGIKFQVVAAYASVIDRCRDFLVETYGSPIPDDFQRIAIVKYEPVFALPTTQIHLPERNRNLKLQMIGEGAYAFVYRYDDPDYGIPFALKRAKSGLDEGDLIRFRKEFDLLHSLRFPYVLEVYRFNYDKNEYTMEFCDCDLGDFIKRRNAGLSFGTRKRIVLQFLYGLNYLHSKGHLHRDISLRNTLVKQYDGSAVLVKLSDFGLAKISGSELTRTESELRGTILDPTIRSFKDYGVLNEVYSIGVVLSYVFSGQRDINACSGSVKEIVDRCVSHTLSERYTDVYSIIEDVEFLESDGIPSSATA